MTTMTGTVLDVSEPLRLAIEKAAITAQRLDSAYREFSSAFVQPEVVHAERFYAKALIELVRMTPCPSCGIQVGMCRGKPSMARRLWGGDEDLYCHIPRVRLANEYAIAAHGINILI